MALRISMGHVDTYDDTAAAAAPTPSDTCRAS